MERFLFLEGVIIFFGSVIAAKKVNKKAAFPNHKNKCSDEPNHAFFPAYLINDFSEMVIILSKVMIRNVNIFPKQKNKSHSSEKSPRQEWGMELLIDLFSLGT